MRIIDECSKKSTTFAAHFHEQTITHTYNIIWDYYKTDWHSTTALSDTKQWAFILISAR